MQLLPYILGVLFLTMGEWNFLQKELPVAARYIFFLLAKSTATASVLMINLYMAEVQLNFRQINKKTNEKDTNCPVT